MNIFINGLTKAGLEIAKIIVLAGLKWLNNFDPY